MSSARRGDRSSLQKIEITCKTCGVKESFYSDLSVQKFKARHVGHEVVGGGKENAPAKTVEAPSKVVSVPVQNPPTEKESGTKLSRLVVDVVVFPALRDSVFRVRGFKDDLEEAFVATSRFENGEMVKRMLESGEYVDYQGSGNRYVWDAAAIDYDGDARDVLGIQLTTPAEAKEPEPVMLETLEEDTVARSNDMLVEEARSELESPKVDSVFPVAEDILEPATLPVVPETPEAPEVLEVIEQPAPEPVVESVEEVVEEVVEEPQIPVPALVKEPEQQPVPVVESKQPEPAPAKVPAPPAEEELLLVSKTWYIQGGDKNKKEAVRVSKVLKDFRWKIEPLYTIGLILDDILSVETNKGNISRPLIRRVEGAGYRLTAVTVEQGKPVAWFKRVQPKVPVTPEPQAGATEETAEGGEDEDESEPDLVG